MYIIYHSFKRDIRVTTLTIGAANGIFYFLKFLFEDVGTRWLMKLVK